MKMLPTTKLFNFSRSTTFIFTVSPSEVVWKIQISNLRNSNVVFHGKMISNENIFNYKVLQIIKICNFHFGHLFMWLCLNNLQFEFQKMITSNNILKEQMISADKAMNIKVVALIKIYNFYFSHLLIRQSSSIHCS